MTAIIRGVAICFQIVALTPSQHGGVVFDKPRPTFRRIAILGTYCNGLHTDDKFRLAVSLDIQLSVFTSCVLQIYSSTRAYYYSNSYIIFLEDESFTTVGQIEKNILTRNN